MTMEAKRFLSDVTAGLTVSFAAISLGAAFGAMSGRGAFAGMIGAAVIPIITSTFGGTRLQASGPTAPMTAVSSVTVAFAYDNFPDKTLAEQFITLVFILNAVCLLLAGFIRLGKLISYVPNVVILGFMNGIAVLIWKDQIVKVAALNGKPVMEGGIGLNIMIALVTFGMIYGIVWGLKKLNVRKQIRSLISGVLWSIIIMTVVCIALGLPLEKIQFGNTIGSFSEFAAMVANYFPTKILQQQYLMMALPLALQLTLLAYLDSLLTALIIDRMTHEKSNLNKELMAQGLANGLSGIFQGIPGAQATIRSVLLIKEGAQTRLAGVLIGVFALLSILVFKDYLALVPAAVFVGVLLKAGLDVCDKDFPSYYLQYQWFQSPVRNIQLLFILYTTVMTVLVDLNIAVLTGTIFFYISKYFWKIQDVESDFEQVSEQEAKLITG
jgi:SulP family sulfate permease